jgi:hypothetical protein
LNVAGGRRTESSQRLGRALCDWEEEDVRGRTRPHILLPRGPLRSPAASAGPGGARSSRRVRAKKPKKKTSLCQHREDAHSLDTLTSPIRGWAGSLATPPRSVVQCRYLRHDSHLREHCRPSLVCPPPGAPLADKYKAESEACWRVVVGGFRSAGTRYQTTAIRPLAARGRGPPSSGTRAPGPHRAAPNNPA